MGFGLRSQNYVPPNGGSTTVTANKLPTSASGGREGGGGLALTGFFLCLNKEKTRTSVQPKAMDALHYFVIECAQESSAMFRTLAVGSHHAKAFKLWDDEVEGQCRSCRRLHTKKAIVAFLCALAPRSGPARVAQWNSSMCLKSWKAMRACPLRRRRSQTSPSCAPFSTPRESTRCGPLLPTLA